MDQTLIRDLSPPILRPGALGVWYYDDGTQACRISSQKRESPRARTKNTVTSNIDDEQTMDTFGDNNEDNVGCLQNNDS